MRDGKAMAVETVAEDEILISPRHMEYGRPYFFDFQGARLAAVKVSDSSATLYEIVPFEGCGCGHPRSVYDQGSAAAACADCDCFQYVPAPRDFWRPFEGG